MNKNIDTNKLNKLQKLNALLPHEIRGQSQVLPRIVSAVQRGEFGLTKPGRRCRSRLCWPMRRPDRTMRLKSRWCWTTSKRSSGIFPYTNLTNPTALFG